MATCSLDSNSNTSGLAGFQDAIDQISVSEKVDYLEALRVAPHLVEMECGPLHFLRFANNNAIAAAQGVVTYWKRRRETFKERAFLPMTICGKYCNSHHKKLKRPL